MDYQSPPRHRPASRSLTPLSRYTRSPSPPRRRASPVRSPSRGRNGRYRSASRSMSRDRESRSPLRGSTKIVVEKLTKNINEDHLYEIFGQYGPIRDLDLPMNRQFGTNRGTAYILFHHESDAEAAISHMHEANVDGATINVSIVLQRRKFSPGPPLASRGANIDPRLPAPGPRGGRGPGGPPGGGRMSGPGVGRPPARSPRYGRPTRDNFDTYRPRSVSRSRSPAPRRNRSPSGSYGSRSRSPPKHRGGGRGGHADYDARRRSPSYDSYRGRSRSRSVGRGYR